MLLALLMHVVPQVPHALAAAQGAEAEALQALARSYERLKADLKSLLGTEAAELDPISLSPRVTQHGSALFANYLPPTVT